MSNSTPRCGVIAGPCKIVTPTGTFATTGDVKLSLRRKSRDLISSLRGKIGKVNLGMEISITAELAPIPSYALLLILMQPANIGASIFGCTDSYLDIHGADGIKLRFKAGGVRKPPPVRWGGNANLYGDTEWAAVVGNDTDIGVLENVLTSTSSSFTAPQAAGDATLWQTKAGVLVYGDEPSAPFDEVISEDTIELLVSYTTRKKENAVSGFYDELITAVNVSLKLKPQEMTVAQLLSKMPVDGPSAVPGLNLASLAEPCQINTTPLAEGDLICTLPAMVVDESNLAWGAESNRIGELTLIGIDSWNGSALNPLYTLALHEEE